MATYATQATHALTSIPICHIFLFFFFFPEVSDSHISFLLCTCNLPQQRRPGAWTGNNERNWDVGGDTLSASHKSTPSFPSTSFSNLTDWTSAPRWATGCWTSYLGDPSQFLSAATPPAPTPGTLGVPQGCVLSPLFFTLLTYDFTPKQTSNIFKFAKKQDVFGRISDRDYCRDVEL